MKRNSRWLLFVICSLVLGLMSAPRVAAQGTETVLHSFAGGQNDGTNPLSRPVFDAKGNLYGTTIAGGTTYWAGAVYQLKPSKSGWTESMIYSFNGGNDGNTPEATVTIDKAGHIYGTTMAGGGTGCGGYGCGTVYQMIHTNTGWTEKILYSFKGGIDGLAPYLGSLTVDDTGNIYGTGNTGGKYGFGIAFKLAKTKSGWKKTTLYSFKGGNDGATPNESLVFDAAGNLYGATYAGGPANVGVVFQLSPGTKGWKEKVLWAFTGGVDGAQPYESVTIDKAGNLYGTTFGGGANAKGVVYKLTRGKSGAWKQKVVYAFTGGDDGANPYSNVTIGKDGALYGTTDQAGADSSGVLYKLTHSAAGWTQTVLYTFTGGNDGGLPLSAVSFDTKGNIYGTTVQGGTSTFGTVYEFQP